MATYDDYPGSESETDWAVSANGIAIKHGMKDRSRFQKIMVRKVPNSRSFESLTEENPDLKKTRPELSMTEEEKSTSPVDRQEQLLVVGLFLEDTGFKKLSRFKTLDLTTAHKVPAHKVKEAFRVATRLKLPRNYYALIDQKDGLCEAILLKFTEVLFFNEYYEGLTQSTVDKRQGEISARIQQNTSPVSEQGLSLMDDRTAKLVNDGLQLWKDFAAHPSAETFKSIRDFTNCDSDSNGFSWSKYTSLLERFVDYEMEFTLEQSEQLVQVFVAKHSDVRMNAAGLHRVRTYCCSKQRLIEFRSAEKFLISYFSTMERLVEMRRHATTNEATKLAMMEMAVHAAMDDLSDNIAAE